MTRDEILKTYKKFLKLEKLLNKRQENKNFGKQYDRLFIEWLHCIDFLKIHKKELKQIKGE